MSVKTSSNRSRIGRILMTVATLVYGVIPPIVDLTETHVFHPDWTPHSRMHMVWLLVTNSSLAAIALYLLWRSGIDRARVRMAGILGLCVYGGFMISAATVPFYGGALSDGGGVPPVFGVDANIVTFTLGLLVLLLGWRLTHDRSESNP
ncbi:MAG: hypothetical protein JNM27_11610 [Leptospirales bacterium]|nr:hypothetical protein [Leptospirales bacterium]